MEITEIQYATVRQSWAQTSYNNEIGQFLRDHKVAIPPWNKYIAPVTKYFKPYATKICRMLWLSSEAYKSDIYFSIKEYLKKSKDNVIYISNRNGIFTSNKSKY